MNNARLTFRYDAAQADKALKLFYPDAEARRAILESLADSVRIAHASAPGAWEITLSADRSFVKMNIGNVRVLRLTKGGVLFLVADDVVPREVKESLDRDQDVYRVGGFLSEPTARTIPIAAEAFRDAYSQLATAHREILRRISKRWTLSPPQIRKAHSPGVLSFLRQLGLDVPNPSYAEASSPTNGADNRDGVADSSHPTEPRGVIAARKRETRKSVEVTASRRDQVFISYSRADIEWKNRLLTHLSPLVHDAQLVVWDDSQISPGAKWREEISLAMSRTRVAVLLVSPDYLASDFVRRHELPEFLEASEEEGLTILWIPISPSVVLRTALK
ncbi:MAG: TIR domain-containing protein, partial [Gemmatimonadota bacterium]|nr:TIR domain-containing protein [Gemmatimonadota bacterium]